MKKNKGIDIAGRVIAIVQHESDEGGPGKVLLEYVLSEGANTTLHIAHPNLYIKSGFHKSSRFDTYNSNTLTFRAFAHKWKLPEWMLYIKDVLYTLKWVYSAKGKVDIFIGLGNLNALCGVILKCLGKVDFVIYYVIDFIPNRFQNNVLNSVYRRIEKYAAQYSDSTWNLSERIITGREKLWHTSFPHQLVVPHGLYFDPKKIASEKQIKEHSLVYMGYLNKEQGIDFVIESIPTIVKKIHDFSFLIIGTGNYESELRDLVKKLKIEKYIRFTGMIQDITLMEKEMAKCSLGVAMYNPSHAFSYYADPGKIKHYLSVGLPVILSNGPSIGSVIESSNCGMVLPFNTKIFVQSVTSLFENKSRYADMRKNAVRLAKNFDWNLVLNTAFTQSLS